MNYSNFHNFSSTEPSFSPISFYCSCLMVFLCMFGIGGNLASAIVFGHPRMRQPINMLLLALSLSDLLLLTLSIPSFALPGINMVWRDAILHDFLQYTAVFGYPIACTCQTVSIALLVVITLERYVAVCHPLAAMQSKGTKRTHYIILSIILGAFCYNLSRFFEYYVGTMGEKDNTTLFALDWLRKDELYQKIYSIFLFTTLHFAVPFLLIAVMNIYIIYRIRKAQRERQALSTSQEKEHKTAVMISIVIGMFVLTNTSPFILNIYEHYNPHHFVPGNPKADVTFAILDISNTGVVANSALTIFIYLTFSQRYREMFCLTFRCPGNPPARSRSLTLRNSDPRDSSTRRNTLYARMAEDSSRRHSNLPDELTSSRRPSNRSNRIDMPGSKCFENLLTVDG